MGGLGGEGRGLEDVAGTACPDLATPFCFISQGWEQLNLGVGSEQSCPHRGY